MAARFEKVQMLLGRGGCTVIWRMWILIYELHYKSEEQNSGDKRLLSQLSGELFI